MKASSLVSLLALALAAGSAGWFLHGLRHPGAAHDHGPGGTAPETRRVRFYQSPMHPWIKSDQPGNCTICGMALVPVYEGDQEVASGTNLITLSPTSINVVGVQVSSVEKRPLVRTLRVAGTLDDDDTRHRILSAYVDGRIESLSVNYPGAEVTAGQPLASFYSPMLLAAVREYVALHAGQAPPTAELAPIHQAAALRLRQMGLAESQITELPRTFVADQITLPILAPLSGTVVKRSVYAGQYVREGDAMFELADFTTMWFKFDAYERDLVWLQPGQLIEVTTPSVPDRVFTNAITFIDPNVDEMARVAKVRVEIPNPLVSLDGRSRRLLNHRVYAEGRVKIATEAVPVVPRLAVLNPDGRPFAWVERSPGAYERRDLRLGRLGDDGWEVLDGLAAGESVVTRGGLLLDAQAQLQHGDPTGAPAPAPSAGNTPALPALPPAALAPVRQLLEAIDQLREALAGDNLGEFNRRLPAARTAASTALAAVGDQADWKDSLAPVGPAFGTTPAPDLASARREYHTVSLTALPVARALRAAGGAFASLKLYQCPMTSKAFPGAPKSASWFQWSGPIRNPWYGSEMIDCGTEIR
ncbi:MAG: efflux RND transporter periplasmic adaptor subunit [Verrucomicrobiota bacterium]